MIRLEKEALIELANQMVKDESWYVEGFEFDDAEAVGGTLVLTSSQMLSLPREKWGEATSFAFKMGAQYTLL